MKKTTPLFPGLHLQTLRKTPKSAQHKLADELARFREKSFSQIGACFKSYIPDHFLLPEKTGEMSRRRLYSKENTFWPFSLKHLTQMVDVRKLFVSFKPMRL